MLLIWKNVAVKRILQHDCFFVNGYFKRWLSKSVRLDRCNNERVVFLQVVEHCPSRFVKNTGNFTRTMMEVKEDGWPESMSAATVEELYDISPTVKRLMLHVNDGKLSFLAGQWVDFFIPTEKLIGGYSICSSPKLLNDTGRIELAVKLSSHPAVQWIHSKCCPGSNIGLRVGGDFYYDPQPSNVARHLLLVAGGVGINPLISIMRHAADVQTDFHNVGQIVLLYSAGTTDEFIFQNELRELLKTNSNMSAQFFVTRHRPEDSPKYLSGITTSYQQINQAMLSSVLHSSFNNRLSDVDCFVCGPNEMIDAINESLVRIGFLQTQIRYEKWW